MLLFGLWILMRYEVNLKDLSVYWKYIQRTKRPRGTLLVGYDTT